MDHFAWFSPRLGFKYISSTTFSFLDVAMVNVFPSHWFVTINKIVLMGRMKIAVSYLTKCPCIKTLELNVVSDQCYSA